MKVYDAFHGWIKNVYKLEHYDYQVEICNRILKAYLLDRTRGAAPEIAVEVSRQAGKTTAIISVVAFLMTWYPGVRIGIFAPQREQAKTDFVRLKSMLAKLDRITGVFAPDESNANTLRIPNGSECYIFPVTPTSHPEGKTLDLIIVEESQNLNDHEFMNDVRPMGAATNAPIIFVGTAGYKICYFYRLIQRQREFIFNYVRVIADKKKMYEKTGDKEHLLYGVYVESEKLRLGEDSDEFKAPYTLKWILGGGQFCTREQLNMLVGSGSRIYQDKISECYAGIDTAKFPDSTVVTIIRKLKEPIRVKVMINGVEKDTEIRKEIANWLELRGDNYKDQFEIIVAFLSKYNIRAVAIDSTGQGDFMPDMFERDTEWQNEVNGLYRVKFTAVSKDIMFKNLLVSIQNLLTRLPRLDTREAERFTQQMTDLQKERKGELISVHHPKSPDAHDDYPDSWALAEHAYVLDQKTLNVDIRFI